MVYLVVGFPRSGTSMLMRAFDSAGIPAVWSPSREKDMRSNSRMIPNYDPNPHGFYEHEDLSNLNWTMCDGKCVKVIRDNLGILPFGCYRAVYITRDPEEIKASYPGTMSGPPSIGEFNFLIDYWNKVDSDIDLLKYRGASVVRLHYPEVVSDPWAAFNSLGWPINVVAAAETVDPSLYRHRGGAKWPSVW